MTTLFELAARIQAAGGAGSMLLMLLKATLILAVARVLLAALPRASAATRHLVATAALVGVAAIPVLTFIVPAWNLAVAPPPAVAKPLATPVATPTPAAAPAPRPQQAQKTIGVTGEETIGTAINLARATGVVPEEPLTAMTRGMNVMRSTWKGLIVLAIDLIALLMLAQMIIGMLGVWYVARRAEEVTQDEALVELDRARDQLKLERDVRLLRSSRISVPVLWGFFRPVLLLPAEVVTWPVDRLRVVLLHELAHLKRFDGISLILTRIAACVFWYHPLAWSLERAGRNDCERACDDLVLAGGTKPSEYADHLLAIARSMPTFDPFRSVTLAMSRKSQLEGRLLSILQPHVVRRAFSGRRVAVACAVVVACLIPISAIRLIAEPSKAKREQVAAKEQQQLLDKKSDATVNVTPDIEALEDYFVTKLGKYDKRIDKFAREPRNGEEWWERAYHLYRNDRYADAAVAFRRAAEEGHRPDTSLYNAACSFALLGDADHALSSLKEAIDAGWDDIDKIAEDSDFDPIRSDPRFTRVVNDSTGEIANRRLNQTMERYNDLRSGGAVSDGVRDGVREGIRDGVREGVRQSVRAGVKVMNEVLSNKKDFNFDFDFDSSNDWFEVGLDLLRLRRLDESIDAFESSIREGQRESTSMYNIACAYSLKGDAATGMRWLDKAIEAGFDGDEKMSNDPDIALLRQQSGFDALRRKAKDLQMGGCCDKYSGRNDRDEWREVMEHHRAMTQKYPNTGRVWMNLGFAALQAREIDTALAAYQHTLQLGYRVGTSSYNMACGYALRGDRNAAFEWLNKARAAKFELGNYIDSDDDLDALRDDPRWDDFREEVKAEYRARQREKGKHKS